ncbi:MAG: MarR family winged helix-turn-helix transcriptional regulator [Woeseiaceae bacterium]
MIAVKDPRYEVIWLIRRLFRAMASQADANLAECDLSAADRAVLEFLYPSETLAVPEIAGRYQVSRQHVQVTVNRLLDIGLVRTEPNPHHKRSPLIALTGAGTDTFAEIRRNESKDIERLFGGISREATLVTRNTLRALYDQLD